MLIIKNAQGGGINLITSNDTPNNGLNQEVDLNDFLNNDIYPIGTILPYFGNISNISSGWYLCNGSLGTPDLRDRFIMGADNFNEANQNITGGHKDSIVPSHSHSISCATAGAHKHAVAAKTSNVTSAGNHTHTQPKAPNFGGRNTCYACRPAGTGYPKLRRKYDNVNTPSQAGHTHTINIPSTGTSSAGGHTHDSKIVTEGVSGVDKNLPKHVKMYYIMKVK